MTTQCLVDKKEKTSRHGDTLTKMMAEALDDITPSRSEGPDT